MVKPTHAKITTLSAAALRAKQYAPQVFLFRNIESGQVLYSQTPSIEASYMYEQFSRPNWENRRPSTRRDIWKCMAVVEVKTYEDAVDTYEALVHLRTRRDVHDRMVVRDQRVRNADGNVWYAGQFRPTYAMEAVADLATVTEEFQMKDTTILWEDLWRKGDDAHWSSEYVTHQELPRLATRIEGAVLKELRAAGAQEMAALKEAGATRNREILKENGIKIEGV